MKTLKRLLEDADPVRHEPPLSSAERHALREGALASASTATAHPPVSRFRLVRVLVPSAIVAVLLVAVYAWSPMAYEARAAVRFEVRLAEESPGPDLREARVRDTNRFVYLHREVLLSNGDIARAELSQNGTEFGIGVQFSVTGEEKVRAATAAHVGKPVAILIDDEVVMAPILRSALGGSAVITGNFTKEQAERIVNGL